MTSTIEKRCVGLVLAAVLLGLCPPAAVAQDVSIPSLKAAFVGNFAKFAEWPEGTIPAGGAFTFCIAGDKAVAQALETIVKSPPTPNAVSVTVVAAGGPFETCQVLYLGGFDGRKARRVIESLQGAPIFTVGDVDGFAEAGGIVQLRLVNGKMRFAINPAAAQRAHIALSVKLLSLATLVEDKY